MAFEAARWSHWDNTKKPNYEALDRLRQIADDWSAEGQHTYAGYVLFSAVDWAWGDGDAVEQCAEQALRELKIAVDLASSHDLDRIAALRVLLNVNGMNYTGANPSDVRALLGSMYEELGQTLLKLSMDAKNPTDRAGLLAHGFVLETEFQGTWRPVFRGFEVNGSAFRLGAGYLAMEIPSAFTLFKNAGDYEAAQTVAAMCPEAFTSHGLRGWRTAIAGLLNPDEAVERFTEASAIFARDVQDEETSKETGHWSSINVDLWAKYFAARAAVAEIVRAPGRATELIRRAGDALNGTESGWGSPQVTCLRTLVNALNDILDSDAVGGVAQAKETLLRRVRRSGLNDEDRLALKFLDQAAHAFALVRDAPARAMVSRHLPDALETLGRIPLIGERVASALEPRIGERALKHLLGPYRTWIYRTIETVTDERALQRLLLRLVQAQMPLYAQIRHGPLEYGKDIVALVEVEDHVLLQMYQVKAGDINVPLWSAVTYQLEQIFLVELDDVQLPVAPHSREGILIFNGHLNTYVEPIVAGWIKQQREQLGRSFRIMHLDDVVHWIIDSRLINELRQALAELGIPIVDA